MNTIVLKYGRNVKGCAFNVGFKVLYVKSLEVPDSYDSGWRSFPFQFKSCIHKAMIRDTQRQHSSSPDHVDVAIRSIKDSVVGVIRVTSFITLCILNKSKICSKFLVLDCMSESGVSSLTSSKLQFKARVCF